MKPEDLSCYGMHADLSCPKTEEECLHCHTLIHVLSFSNSFYREIFFFFSVLPFNKTVLQNLLGKKTEKLPFRSSAHSMRRKKNKKPPTLL